VHRIDRAGSICDLLGIFADVALVLAAIGLFGVTAALTIRDAGASFATLCTGDGTRLIGVVSPGFDATMLQNAKLNPQASLSPSSSLVLRPVLVISPADPGQKTDEGRRTDQESRIFKLRTPGSSAAEPLSRFLHLHLHAALERRLEHPRQCEKYDCSRGGRATNTSASTTSGTADFAGK